MAITPTTSIKESLSACYGYGKKMTVEDFTRAFGIQVDINRMANRARLTFKGYHWEIEAYTLEEALQNISRAEHLARQMHQMAQEYEEKKWASSTASFVGYSAVPPVEQVSKAPEQKPNKLLLLI